MSRNPVAIFLTLILIASTTPLSNADAHGIPHDVNPYNGYSELIIHDELLPNSNITATWTLNISISDFLGSSELVHPGIGIRHQIDQYLGDNDGDLNQSEVDAFSTFLLNRPWNNSELAGCCILDHEAFDANNVTIIPRPPAPGPVGELNGTWGWTETVELVGQTDGRTNRLIDVPRVGGLIEEVPLTISLPTPYEYRYSAMQDVIDGAPNQFTINRSAVPVASDIRISIGTNMPPNIIANRLGSSSQLALDRATTYEVNCVDSCLLYTSPSPRDRSLSRMPSSA